MDISQFSSLLRVLVGALAGGCGSVACLWHCPRYLYNCLPPLILITLVITTRAVLIMIMRVFLMMTTAAMLIDHMGNLDCDHGDSLDHDDAGQVISGEETGLVLLNFIPKPAMVVYNAYTQSVYFCLFLCFILTFPFLVWKFVSLFVCLFVCLHTGQCKRHQWQHYPHYLYRVFIVFQNGWCFTIRWDPPKADVNCCSPYQIFENLSPKTICVFYSRVLKYIGTFFF